MAVCLDCSSLSFQSTLSYSADSLAHSRRISPSNTLHICSESLYRYGNCSTFISGACSAICDRETLAKAMPPYLICSSTSLSEPSFASLSTMMWIRPPVHSCTSSAKPQRYPAPHPGAIDSLRRLCDRCRSRPKFPADASALPFHPSILPSTFPPVKSPSQSLCSYIIFYIFQSVITKYSWLHYRPHLKSNATDSPSCSMQKRTTLPIFLSVMRFLNSYQYAHGSNTKCRIKRNHLFVVLKRKVFRGKFDRVSRLIGIHIDL